MLNIFIAGILWGTIGIFVKELNSLGASSSFICFIRLLSAFVIMFVFAVVKHGRKIFISDFRTIFYCALLGIISQGVFNIFYTTSIKLNGVGIACVLMYTAPIFTAIASRILFKENFSRLKLISLFINIFGCILTVTGGNIFNGADFNLIGLLAGIGTGFCYGMAAIFGRAAGEKTDSIIVSIYSYCFAVIFLFVFSKPDFNFDAKILSVGFLFGLIPTAFAYMIYYNGIKKIRDTSKVPIIASIEPITAVLVGILLYNEKMNFLNFIGFIIVLFSIAIMVREK